MNKQEYLKLLISIADWCLDQKPKAYISYASAAVRHCSDLNRYRFDDRVRKSLDGFIQEILDKQADCMCSLLAWFKIDKLEFKPKDNYHYYIGD